METGAAMRGVSRASLVIVRAWGTRAVGVCALGVCALGVGSCGEASNAPPVPDKTVPALRFLHGGRSLEAWKAVPADADPEERIAAAFGLASLESAPLESVAALRSLLADERSAVQVAGAIAAGRLAPGSAVLAQDLVSLLGSPVEPVRRHARVALGALGPEALPALAGALEDDAVGVRWGALVALAQIRTGTPALRARVEALAGDGAHPAVRRQALRALPRLGPEGIEAALGFLGHDETAVRREAAAGLLAAGEAVVAPLAALLGDGGDIPAAEAAGILADLGPRAAAALPDLLRALTRAGIVRFNAADALIALGPPALPGLRALAEGEDPDLAATARYAIDQIETAHR